MRRFYNGVLIQGNLTAFGFPNPTAPPFTLVPLEFEFQVTGGLLTASGEAWHQATVGGMNLFMNTVDSYFTNGWPSSDFSGSTDGTNADTFPLVFATPEPSTAVLLVLGLLPLAWSLHEKTICLPLKTLRVELDRAPTINRTLFSGTKEAI